jgi:hypothetical protein
MAHAAAGTFFFTHAGITVALNSPSSTASFTPDSTTPTILRLQFLGSNSQSVTPSSPALRATANYFVGNDPAGWHTNIPTYSSISYVALYDGIALHYQDDHGQLKGTSTIAPGADPALIKWRYSAAAQVDVLLQVDAQGDLQIVDPCLGTLLTEQAPLAWQQIGADRVPVEAQYSFLPDGTLTFALGPYDHSSPLIIDPTVTFSTYLGGNGQDQAYGVAVDSSGNAYVSGFTSSLDFPTVNAYQTTNHGTPDAFITKFNPDGSVAYSTYFGGNGGDLTFGIAVDNLGYVYITGETASTNYPTVNAYQPTYTGISAFVTKLDPTGSALLYSTYFGGAQNNDYGWGIAVDNSANAYITGNTAATDFPVLGAYQATYGGGITDAFLARIDTTQSGAASLIYSTYLGGSSSDYGGGSASSAPGHGVAVDSAGNAYLTGETSSPNFPTLNAYDPNLTIGTDAWVAKINTNLPGIQSLVYSTYLGGSACCDYGRDIDIDSSGSAYVTGQTNSPDFPTLNAFQPCTTPSSFVTKFTPAGNALAYSTCLGVPANASDIAVDSNGRAHIVGYTNSSNFPQVNPVQPFGGGTDAFVLSLNSVGNALGFSSFLGGTATDQAYGVAVYGADKLYVVGHTTSTDFPTQSPFQPSYGGSFDAFVTAIDNRAICPIDWNLVSSPNPPAANGNALVDVAAASPIDVWAVGTTADYSAPQPSTAALIEHWDGSAWSISPSPQFTGTHMGGVAAFPNDAWAVGDCDCFTPGPHQPLLLHWDGFSWSLTGVAAITVPSGGIRDVAMPGPGDAWLVGTYLPAGNLAQPLAMRWNGESWDVSPMPTFPARASLQGLAAISPTDIWAVGELDGRTPLFMHWDGTAWTQFNNPTAVSGVLYRASAVSATDIWAVGYLTDGSGLPLTMHYNGTSWSVVPTPLQCCNHELTDVQAISSNDVWAVTRSAFIHWDGSTWNYVTPVSPPPNTAYFLQGLGGAASTDLWAVGNTSTGVGGVFDGTLTEHYSTDCPPPTPTPTITGTPSPTPTNYAVIPITGTIAPGTTDIGNHCDNCVTNINLPFPITLYDGQFSTADVGSNAIIGFIANANPDANACVPTLAANYAIFPYWDDLDTSCGACGVFTSVTGISPSRIFNIEWRALRVAGTAVHFEVRLYEGSGRFDLVYGQVDPQGSESVGVQRDTGSQFTRLICSLSGTPDQPLLGKPDGWIIADGASYQFGDPPGCAVNFTDVPVGSTFYPYIHCLACLGIINGYSDGTFKPNNLVTRGQLSKIVSNAAGFADAQPSRMFQDVPVASTFQSFIGRLASRGFISGYPCGSANEPCVPPANLPYFRPNNNATRGQITKIVSNAAGFADTPTGQQFQDVPVGSTYYTYTYRLVTRSIMAGYPCGSAGEPCVPPADLPYFRPNNNATRGQTSKIVGNTFFPDCSATAIPYPSAPSIPNPPLPSSAPTPKHKT